MNIEEAKAKISTAKNVDEWNEIRETLKSEITPSDLAHIDGSGFINEVKQKNNWPKRVPAKN